MSKRGHLPLVSPVAKIRNQNSSRPVKISLHAFHNLTIALDCARVEFFEYHGTAPEGRIRSDPAQRQGRFVPRRSAENVNGRVEQGGLQLTTQRAVYVLDVNSALEETLSGLENQSVALAFGNHQIQRPLDGLSFGFARKAFGRA